TVISAVIGSGEKGMDAMKPSLRSALNQPAGIVVLPHATYSPADRCLIIDSGNSRLCMHSVSATWDGEPPQTRLRTYCGAGQGNAVGPWHGAKFFRPRAACCCPSRPEQILVCDTNNHVIKLLDTTAAQVFNLTGVTKPGFADGANAAFRFPVD